MPRSVPGCPARAEQAPPQEILAGQQSWSAAGKLNLVHAFDPENTGDFSDVGQNGFQLATVDNFQAGFDAGILAVGAALEAADIGARSADDRGDFREKD